jgi:hypothetical protein
VAQETLRQDSAEAVRHLLSERWPDD